MSEKISRDNILWIANDHGGYGLKKELLVWLEDNGYSVVDCGCDSEAIVRYPFYAAKVAGAVGDGSVARGILICSTGIGMSITANKFPGVRAALCTDTYMAKMTRQHNDANILCLGGRTVGLFTAIDILETWLTTAYLGNRHAISLNLIERMEAYQFAHGDWKGEGGAEYPL